MRIPAPFYTISQEMRYRENHQGIPLRITIFMTLARTGAYLLIGLPLLVASMIIPEMAWPLVFVTMWQGMLPFSRIDIFTPLGFHLFKKFIEVRG